MKSDLARKKPAQKLVAVTLVTSPEAEDAAGALLERELSQTPSVWVNRETGISETSVFLELAQSQRHDLTKRLRHGLKMIVRCGLDIGPGLVRLRQVKPQDWAESWKRHFKPFCVGNQLWIQPTWVRRKARRHEVVVQLDPGLSFGTGQHATTRYCLEQLVVALRVLTKHQPQHFPSFTDLGTGSGILAIAAAKLGYRSIVACDYDPECVRTTAENAVLNQVQQLVQPVQADVLKLSKKVALRNQADVVCANLIYDVLIAGRDRILARTKPTGTLVLAGILKEQFAAVADAYRAAGWLHVHHTDEKEWRSGTFVFQTESKNRTY